MNCPKCGSPLNPGDEFCRNCGFRIPTNQNSSNAQGAQNNVTAPNPNMNGSINTNSNMNQGTPNMGDTNFGGNTYGSNSAPKKSSNVGLIILVIVLILAIVGILVYFLVVKKPAPTINENPPENQTSNQVADNKPGTTPTIQKTASYKVKVGNITYHIPGEYIYETLSDGSIVITNDSGEIAANIAITEGSFNKLEDNLDQLSTIFQESVISTVTLKPAEIKKANGNDVITIEMTDGSDNEVLAFFKVNSMYYGVAEIRNINYTVDYSMLNDLESIMSSVEISDNSASFIKEDSKIDLSKAEKALGKLKDTNTLSENKTNTISTNNISVDD